MKTLTARKIVIFLMFLFVLLISGATALEINDYSAADNDRFSSGYPDNPVNNASMFAASYDLSGIGWDSSLSGRSIAMITPQHFVGSNHYRIATGEDAVTFFNQDGALKSYDLDSYSSFTFGDQTIDLVLGKLSSPIPSGDKITYYSVIDADDGSPSWYNWYLNKELYVYGRTAAMGKNIVNALTNASTTASDMTFCAEYLFHIGGGASYPDEAGLGGGDSGSPLFMPYDGQLTLLGTHFGIATAGSIRSNYDSFIPNYIDDLDSAMSGTGYSVTIVPVPEPSVSGLFFLSILILISFYAAQRIKNMTMIKS